MSERLLRVTKIEELDSGVEITLTDGGSVLKWMVSWEAAATYTFGKSFKVTVEEPR